MNKNILIIVILMNANIKGMENEDDELMMERGVGIIKKDLAVSKIKALIQDNKKALIGAAGGLGGGGVFGYGMETFTKKTDEKGEIIDGWWTRNHTIGTMAFGLFFGGAFSGTYYGKLIGKKEGREEGIHEGIGIGEVRGIEIGEKKGIERGKEIGKKEASEVLKEKIRNKYTSKIEEIQKRDDIDDIIKKFKIDEYLELIKDTENE